MDKQGKSSAIFQKEDNFCDHSKSFFFFFFFFFFCSSSLFVVSYVRFVLTLSFLISSSFGALGRLCLVTAAFPSYLHFDLPYLP